MQKGVIKKIETNLISDLSTLVEDRATIVLSWADSKKKCNKKLCYYELS